MEHTLQRHERSCVAEMLEDALGRVSQRLQAQRAVDARDSRSLIGVRIDIDFGKNDQFRLKILYSGREGLEHCASIDGNALANDDGELDVGF